MRAEGLDLLVGFGDGECGGRGLQGIGWWFGVVRGHIGSGMRHRVVVARGCGELELAVVDEGNGGDESEVVELVAVAGVLVLMDS